MIVNHGSRDKSADTDINDDAAWEAYLAGFNSLNLDKILEIRQGALDRYEAR